MNFHEEQKDPPKFQAKKLGSYQTSTERQIREALVIQKGDYDNIMNSNSEWGEYLIPRQTASYMDSKWKEGD